VRHHARRAAIRPAPWERAASQPPIAQCSSDAVAGTSFVALLVASGATSGAAGAYGFSEKGG
jgi:hypothetical protein